MKGIRVSIVAVAVLVGIGSLYFAIQPVEDEKNSKDVPSAASSADRNKGTIHTEGDAAKKEELRAEDDEDLPQVSITSVSLEDAYPQGRPAEAEPDRGPMSDNFSLSNNEITREAMKVDPPLKEIGEAWLSGDSQSNFTVPVTGNRELEVVVDKFVALGDQGGEFHGSVRGFPGSSVELSYRGKGEAGVIRLPSENRVYRILPAETGSVIISESFDNGDRSHFSPSLPLSSIPPPPDFTPPPPPDFPDDF